MGPRAGMRLDLSSNGHGVGAGVLGVSQLSTMHCSNSNAVTSDYGPCVIRTDTRSQAMI